MTPTEEINATVYAGFWRRFNAYGIDATILFVIAWLIDVFFFSTASAQSSPPDDFQILFDLATTMETGQITPDMQATVIESLKRSMLGGSIIPGPSALLMGSLSAIYNIWFVAGKWQATPGKHWLGMKVVMAGGRRLTLLESFIRHTVSGISIFPMGLGYITMFFTNQKLALHDIICNTRVIRVNKIPTSPG